MKKLLLSISFALFASLSFYAQEAQKIGGPEITFEKDVHDFGNLKQGGDASTEFKFKNTGTEPLIVSNAQGSCGCTVPEWPKEPILPGQSSAIKVKYDSKRVGQINKSVTITSNATNSPSTVIRIKGNIDAVPEQGGMPEKKPSLTTPVEK